MPPFVHLSQSVPLCLCFSVSDWLYFCPCLFLCLFLFLSFSLSPSVCLSQFMPFCLSVSLSLSVLIIIIAIIIIIIVIAFKGAIRDFLQSPHSAANCLQHVPSSGPGATICKSRATHWALITRKCHVTCHLVQRDSSAIKFDRVEIAFVWALFYWLNH